MTSPRSSAALPFSPASATNVLPSRPVVCAHVEGANAAPTANSMIGSDLRMGLLMAISLAGSIREQSARRLLDSNSDNHFARTFECAAPLLLAQPRPALPPPRRSRPRMQAREDLVQRAAGRALQPAAFLCTGHFR